MKTPAEQLKESLKQFDKEFTHKDVWGSEELHFLNEGNPKNIKHFLTTHTISILQGEIERVSTTKSKLCEYPDNQHCDCKYKISRWDIITHLEEEIRKINHEPRR